MREARRGVAGTRDGRTGCPGRADRGRGAGRAGVRGWLCGGCRGRGLRGGALDRIFTAPLAGDLRGPGIGATNTRKRPGHHPSDPTPSRRPAAPRRWHSLRSGSGSPGSAPTRRWPEPLLGLRIAGAGCGTSGRHRRPLPPSHGCPRVARAAGPTPARRVAVPPPLPSDGDSRRRGHRWLALGGHGCRRGARDGDAPGPRTAPEPAGDRVTGGRSPTLGRGRGRRGGVLDAYVYLWRQFPAHASPRPMAP